ncbi:hypothetical protein HERIO_2460 [Hepatospora eriocheir]|uniref:Uncharacterized protein n=1 Tax=Hepatospora eriocheir TaxID=1081669 RepID=A0A1X0Q6V3_9MICR|nr:hypothetical protein HERIO_2460 [Hepatospora eriocheir]
MHNKDCKMNQSRYQDSEEYDPNLNLDAKNYYRVDEMSIYESYQAFLGQAYGNEDASYYNEFDYYLNKVEEKKYKYGGDFTKKLSALADLCDDELLFAGVKYDDSKNLTHKILLFDEYQKMVPNHDLKNPFVDTIQHYDNTEYVSSIKEDVKESECNEEEDEGETMSDSDSTDTIWGKKSKKKLKKKSKATNKKRGRKSNSKSSQETTNSQLKRGVVQRRRQAIDKSSFRVWS